MIIFDLDHTLFDTSLIRKDFCKIFGDHGICEDEFLKTFYEAYDVDQDSIGCYHYDKHCRVLNRIPTLELDQIRQELKNSMVTRGKDFLYPDVLPALEYFKKKNIKMVLLSKGVENFQIEKLEVTGIKEYFNQIIIVLDDKIEAIKNLARIGKIFNINDHFLELVRVKENFPEVISICILRPDRKTNDVPAGFPVVNSLVEVIKYIELEKT